MRRRRFTGDHKAARFSHSAPEREQFPRPVRGCRVVYQHIGGPGHRTSASVLCSDAVAKGTEGDRDFHQQSRSSPRTRHEPGPVGDESDEDDKDDEQAHPPRAVPEPRSRGGRQGASRSTRHPPSARAAYRNRSCSRFSRPCQNSTASGTTRNPPQCGAPAPARPPDTAPPARRTRRPGPPGPPPPTTGRWPTRPTASRAAGSGSTRRSRPGRCAGPFPSRRPAGPSDATGTAATRAGSRPAHGPCATRSWCRRRTPARRSASAAPCGNWAGPPRPPWRRPWRSARTARPPSRPA